MSLSCREVGRGANAWLLFSDGGLRCPRIGDGNFVGGCVGADDEAEAAVAGVVVFSLEGGGTIGGVVLTVGLLVLATGFGLLVRSLWLWKKVQFGPRPSMEENLRRLIPAATLILLGVQSTMQELPTSVKRVNQKYRERRFFLLFSDVVRVGRCEIKMTEGLA